MNYSIVYTSKTGNTAKLAERIMEVLPKESCRYCGSPAPGAADADCIFAGFWVDKGTCSEEVSSFLRGLSGKAVFLFGTAGFGGEEAYFNRILARVKAELPESCTVVGTYMCQGGMPLAVRSRYEAMEDREKAEAMLENFDKAASHPDTADLDKLAKVIADVMQNR